MYRPGHYGVALVLYAPVGGAFLALGEPLVALAGGAVVLWLTMLPDLDSHLPYVAHRGPTHTLPFVALVAGCAWLGASAIGLDGNAAGSLDLRTFAAVVAALSILAHLTADLLTPMGVALLWPLTRRRFTLSVTTADSSLWNYALFALGVFATAASVYLGANVLALGGATTLIPLPPLLPV